MRLHRLIAILLLIESRGQMKAKELADALETSVRTIYRDVEILCESGVPLAATSGPSGGIYLMKEYNVSMNHLYRDDVINLYLCGVGIHPEGQSDAGIKLKDTLLKLEKSLPAQYRTDIIKARERFYYDEVPWWGERPDMPYLETIRRAVWKSKKLKILYGRNEKEYSERIVHPYGMVVKNMEWYLAAFCELSSEVRTFKCERVHSAEILEETFEIPIGFSLEQYWKRSEEYFKKERTDIEKYIVTIKLYKKDSDLLKRLEVYEANYDTDYIFARVNMHKYEYACHEAMDIAGRAEIMEPYELRKVVIEQLKKIIEGY